MPRKNTLSADYPQAILHQIEQLAHNIAIARKRRGESQAQWAKKLGVSQPTMVRIERGDPSVAIASYVMCMWLINQAEGLADLVAPQHDHTALEKEVAKVRFKGKPSKQVRSSDRQPRDAAVGSASAVSKDNGKLTQLALKPTASTSTSKLSVLDPRTTIPLDDIRKSMAHATKLSDLVAQPTSALDDIRKSLAHATKLSDLVSQPASALDDIRKSLERATKLSDLAAPSAASGIAALLTNPGRRNK